MSKSSKVVHLNFEDKDHLLLKQSADSLGMPLATYAKALVLSTLERAAAQRTPRKITNNRG